MSIFQRLALLLTGLLSIAALGFGIGLRFQPQERKIDSILFSSEHPSLIEPRWLVSYLKGHELGNYPHVEIDEKKMHPIFQTLSVTRYPPSSLYVHYCLRQVAFIIDDYANLGLDPNGVLIALYPFHTPKKAVHVFLGEKQGLKLGAALEERCLSQLKMIQQKIPDALVWIDLSQAESIASKRTINLGIEQDSFVRGGKKTLLVRLHPDRLEEGLTDLKAFLKSVPILGMETVVRLDLRHKGLGFLRTVEH